MMGLAAGASVVNMHEGFVTLPFYPPASLTHGILVNAQGQRFVNEDCYHGRVGYFCLSQLGSSVYLVFNAEDLGTYQDFNYLAAEICAVAESVEELEQELGLPDSSLVETVRYYNRYASRGVDPLFHKAAEWLKPLEGTLGVLNCTPGEGAFYPFFTLGGLETRPSGEVMRPDGSIVSGLYAAGRATCGLPTSAAGYASGMSVGDATFFGRLSGSAAARRRHSRA
jgi:succinate dehydrogenase/fumarate reductase flavoprotein subunit